MPSWRGDALSTISPDSVTALLFLVDTCPACELHMPTYPMLAVAAKTKGIAFRVVASYLGEVPEGFLNRIPEGLPVLLDGEHLLREALGVSSVPLLLVASPEAGGSHKTLLPGPGWPRPGTSFEF